MIIYFCLIHTNIIKKNIDHYNSLLITQYMIRKISTKLTPFDERSKRPELKTSDNEYYLPYPQVRLVKTPIK